MAIVIAGFSNADKVPGAYGQIVYGAGGNSAANIPLLVLLVGLQTSSGNLTADTQLQPVFSLADCDYYAGAGSELACMGYDALTPSENQGAQVFIMSPTAAGGAVAAFVTLACTGSPTAAGSVTVRIDGYPVACPTWGTSDTPTTIAASIASAINGANSSRLPLSATSSVGVVTITDKTAGIRGNQHVVALDTSYAQSTGMSFNLGGTPWVALTTYAVGNTVTPIPGNGYYYAASAITSGTSGSSQPSWPTTVGTTVTDSGVTWKCVGIVATGGLCFLSQGTGLETYTNLLASIANVQMDRPGLACNDATSLAAWLAQVNSQAGAVTGILEQVTFATNSTLAAATSLAGTTLNSQRFCELWEQNSETHPSRMAAYFATLRSVTEEGDPAFAYMGTTILTTVVGQTQAADRPNHATLVSALNSGVTPIITNKDGLARIGRGITTHCLNGSNPDYSCLDLAESVVPDYVLRFFKGYYASVFQADNPRLQPDPSPSDPLPPTGVGYPSLWTSSVTKELMKMEAGLNPGTCPPIIIEVDENLPTSEWNAVHKCIMSAIPVDVADGNYQIGLQINQIG